MLPFDVQDAVRKKAAEFGFPAAHVAAITEVESNGQVFAIVEGQKRPVILFEPHLFYRALTGAARAEAVTLELASKRWNKALYPKTQAGRWVQMKAAADLLLRHGLEVGPAYESASYGVGQVLGSHWRALGYGSFEAFLKTMMSGVEGQIHIMLQYVVANGLDDELIDGRWAAFARGYNGPSYAKNRYDKKMAAAAKLYGGAVSAPDGMLRMGSKGARVRELQALLVRAGHQVRVDGDFGPATKTALMAFQTAHGIRVDGVCGPETESALADLRQGSADAPGKVPVTELKEAKEGLGGAAIAVGIEVAQSKVDQATEHLQQIEAISPYIQFGLTALSVTAAVLAVTAVGWAIYGIINSRKTVEA